MRPKEVMAFLTAYVRYPQMPAVFIWGGAGVGKSRVCRQIAAQEHMNFRDLRLTLMDPTDLRGIPVPENGKAKWLAPNELPKDGEGILLFDEMNLAPPMMQAAAYQIVLDRKIGEYHLPDGWWIIATGNNVEDCAYIHKMAAPLRNRFVHIEFETNLDDWRAWAIQHAVDTKVIEFISFRPDLLHKFDSKRHDKAFPTPRSWEFVSNILKGQNGLADSIVEQAVRGTVGDGAALEFKGYLEIRSQLPKIAAILDGENYIPKQPDVACALVAALAVHARQDQYDRLAQYAEKLDAEIAAVLAKLLASKDKTAWTASKLWKTWAVKHQELFL